MQKENLQIISKKLVSDEENYMDSFRKNLDMYLSVPGITIKALSEEADIPFATLNGLLYGDSKNCKLSTAIALAKALGVSIDELVGAKTIPDDIRDSIATFRNLPESAKHLILWYIQHQEVTNSRVPKGRRILSVMEPVCTNNGNLKIQDIYKHIDITDLPSEIKSKVFIGMRIPCEHYMPIYSPYNILLIANDRHAMPNEHVLITVDNCLFICKRRIVDGVAKFYSLRDDRYRMDEKDVDEVVGYIVHTITQSN